MPTVVLCPKCRRPVSLPVASEAAAPARCPLCRGEFQLHETLVFAPPELELITSPLTQHPSAEVVGSSEARSVAASSATEAVGNSAIPDLLINPDGGYVTRPDGEFLLPSADELPGASREIQSSATPPAAPARRRRKQRNFPVDLLKIVAGGLAGSAIAYAILLWGFKVDLFTFANRIAPATVPDQEQSPTSPAPEGTERSSPDSSIGSPSPSTSSLPSLPEPQPLRPEPEIEVSGPKSEQSYSLSDVSRAFRGAREAIDKLQVVIDGSPESDPSTLRQARKQYYVKLAELAEVITHSRDHSSDAQTIRALAVAFVLNLADDPTKRDELSRLAGAWVDSPNRSSNGVALIGTVQKVEASGKFYRTDVKLIGREPTVGVISSEMPKLSPTESVLVLGVIVTDPAQAIAGYEGPNETVVWSAISERLAGH